MKEIELETQAPQVPAQVIRVLLLEEFPGDSVRILDELRSAGMNVNPTVARDRLEFLEAVATQEFSIILSAYRLPEWSGLDAYQELQKIGSSTPFILLAGASGEGDATDCLRLGVSDYVLKSHFARLPLAIQRALKERELRRANVAAKQALAQSEERNRRMINQSVYGVFRITLDGSFVFANPSLLEVLACSSLSALQTLNFRSDVFRFPEHCAKLMASCRKDGLVHNAEVEWRRKDGGLVAVKLHLRYLSMAEEPDQMEGIMEDVTELRALERQLLQAQRFEIIGQLAGGVAHDFNNVVGAIRGWAELGYAESGMFPQIAERFARIRQQADRAALLTRELLAFARCQELQARPIDLNTVVQGLASFLEKIIEKNIEMRLLLGRLPVVQADPVQIEQVLMNLCLNARDAMPEGGRLTIETGTEQLDAAFCSSYPHAKAGQHVVLSVSDTGVGMAPGIRERIFEPFFTTKEHGKGTGMGLATAYGIVKQHGGFLQVYSERWQGSLFRVYLPATGENAQKTRVETHGEEDAVPGSLEGTETILIADDHESVREMARQWLTSLGYRVLSAANKEEVGALCEQQAPELAILDLVMPGTGGPATAITLRERYPTLPVVFSSGHSEDANALTASLPGSYYLQKPYSLTALARLIRKILSPKESRAAEIR